MGTDFRGLQKGMHAWDGKCMPDKEGKDWMSRSGIWESFSVGIFAWEPRAKGRGLKRGLVKVRVRGWCSHPEAVYARAEEIVKMLDKGEYFGPLVSNLKYKKYQPPPLLDKTY